MNDGPTENATNRSDALLRQGQQIAGIGYFEWAAGDSRIYCTDGIFRLLDLPVPADGLLTPDLIYPRLPEGELARIREIGLTLNGQEHFSFQHLMTDLQGRTRNMQCRGVVEYGKDGNPQKITGSWQDISQWRDMEEDLERQNYMLQQAQDTANLGSWKYNLVTEQAYYSDSLFRIFGYEERPADPDINEMATRIVPEDLELIRNTYNQTLQDGISRKASFRLTVPGAGLRFFTSNGKLAKNRAGQQILIGTVRDVTEQHLLSSELAAQHDLVQKLIDSSVNCILVLDREKRYTLWNRRCEELYQIPGSAAIGKTVTELFGAFDTRWFEDAVDRALSGEKVMIAEWPSALTGRYYEFHLQPLTNAAGTIDQVFVLIHDITELKKLNGMLEDKNKELADRAYFLETLLDSSFENIAVYDRELRLLEINKAVMARWGFSKETIIGKTVYELFPGIEGTRTLENLKEVLKGGTVADYEMKSIRDGRYFRSTLIPLRNNEGKVYAVLAIGYDITDIRQTMEELEALNNQLAGKNYELNRINSELASFSYVASHDLQEPLRKIQAFVSLLLARDVAQLSDTGKDYFNRIQASANKMQQMIDGLLSFSRTNTAARSFEPANLNELVSNIQVTFLDEISRRNARIEMGPLHQLSVIPHQFEQMLEHIVGNALKFCAAGRQPVISIVSELVSGRDIQEEVAQRNKNYYRINIRDNGIGFEMDNAERIFQLFQRLNGKSEYPGTGIGLAICRRIAQNHNGFITVDSKPGEGSVFHIFIPQETEAVTRKERVDTFAE